MTCIIDGFLHLLIIYNYINTHKKNDIYCRKKTLVIILIFDFIINLIFILIPFIFILFSLNNYNFTNDKLYFQFVGLFHMNNIIDFISTLFPMFLLLWHIFDIINLFEEKYQILILPKKDQNTETTDDKQLQHNHHQIHQYPTQEPTQKPTHRPSNTPTYSPTISAIYNVTLGTICGCFLHQWMHYIFMSDCFVFVLYCVVFILNLYYYVLLCVILSRFYFKFICFIQICV